MDDVCVINFIYITQIIIKKNEKYKIKRIKKMIDM